MAAEFARRSAELARHDAELAMRGANLDRLGAQIERQVNTELARASVKLAGLGSKLQKQRGDESADEDWYARGLRLHHRGRFKEAIAAFEKAIDADQRADDASYNIACGYAQLNDAEHAAEWLKKAADEGADVESMIAGDDDFDPIRHDARFRAAVQQLHAQRGSRHSAETRALQRRYERLARRAPKSDGPWYDLGKELLDAGSYDLAQKAFEAAAQRANDPGNALYNAACALALKGESKAALDALQRAVEQGFDDVHQLKKDDDLDAVRDDARFAEIVQLARDLELDVEQGSFVLDLGSVHVWSKKSSKKRNAEDVAHYQEMAKKHAQLGRAQFNLGYAQLAANDLPAAEAAFTQAVELGYRKGTSLYNRACAQAREGHKDAAIDSLKAAIDAGFDAKDYLSDDDDLESLHADARFRQLKHEAGKGRDDDEDDDE